MTVRPIIIVLLAVMMCSCEKRVNVRLGDIDKKLVLNLLMNKDSIMMAHVSTSGQRTRNGSPMLVDNAVVNLYENGTFVETLSRFYQESTYYYRSKLVPKAGATYKVTATAPNYSEISGTDVIPDTVAVGEMKLTTVRQNNNEDKAIISVQLHDDPAVQNYYRIRLYTYHKLTGSFVGWYKELHSFQAEEASIGLLGDAKYRVEFITTDALFNGRSPKFTFRANIKNDVDRFLVEVSALTPASYNYLNSAAMAAEKNKDGLSEVVIVYNNIENGLGIVGGVAQREYLLMR